MGINKKELYIEMGTRIRQARRAHDYTQEQLAEMLGVSTAYYGKIERGVHGISIEKLIVLGEKLDMDLTYVLTGKDKNTIIFNNVLEKCPLGKRYDFEQIIKYALNLAREKDNEDCNL